jgi:hypothetical protein
MTMKLLGLMTALGAAAALSATDAALLQGQNPNPWTWRGTVAQGRTLEIRGVMGTIRAEPSSGREVEVTARKHAEDSDPDEVRIEVVQEGGDVTICAVYPGWGNSCEPGGGENHTRRHNDVHVDFTVRVPAGVSFVGAAVSSDVSATGLTGRVELSSVSGNVAGTGLGGPAELHSVSGDVELETASGEASGRSVSGSVRATVRGGSSAPLRFSSVSGDLTISLPRDLGADIEMSSVSGEMSSDFPLTLGAGGRVRRSHMRARIGSGGRTLSLSTVSGDVQLRALP